MALRFDERDSLDFIFGYYFVQIMTPMPNKSPEPTAVAAAVAIHDTNRRWLSFFR
jgi:hypothetical protein